MKASTHLDHLHLLGKGAFSFHHSPPPPPLSHHHHHLHATTTKPKPGSEPSSVLDPNINSPSPPSSTSTVSSSLPSSLSDHQWLTSDLLHPLLLDPPPLPLPPLDPYHQPIDDPPPLDPPFPRHHHPQDPIDHLLMAAELIESGNPTNAQWILARLNQQYLSLSGTPPLTRSAFYFKEALDSVAFGVAPSRAPSSLLDVVLKIAAYKAFSEISPVTQFAGFTSALTILEALAGRDRIHIVDFDIGLGGQWSSLLLELSRKRVCVRITAFVSPSSYHPLELFLTRDNLTQFANDLDVPFEFDVLGIDSFDPTGFVGNEAIAVSLPVGLSNPALLRGIKQLSPKVVVTVEHGCNRFDLPFAQHLLNLLHSYTVLLESIDAAGASLDVTEKIERLILQPRIENAVLGRARNVDGVVPWRTMFVSSGFVPHQFSNPTELQAECLLKRAQVRGFQVEKHQSSMVLFWQQGELVSLSAWS